MKVRVGFLVKDLMGIGITNPKDDFREAGISRWYKGIGDTVGEGEALVEIEADKVTQDLVSPCAGVLISINYKAGDKWEYGGVDETSYGEILLPELCVIEIPTTTEGDVGTPTPGGVGADQEPAEEAPRESGGEGEEASEDTSSPTVDEALRSRFTHVAWNIADAYGLNPRELISAFEGSGKIGKDFVKGFIEKDQGAPISGIIQAVPKARSMMQDEGIDPTIVEYSGDVITVEDVERHKAEATEQSVEEEITRDDRVALGASQLRKTVAHLLERSKREIPHAGDKVEINVSRLREFRENHKDVWRAATGNVLRYDHFFMYLVAQHLRLSEFKVLNAYWDSEAEDAFLFKDVNLGVAVQTPTGLMVPVIHGAQKLSFSELVSTTEDKVERALQGKIKLADLRDLTFTVNNPGAVGGEHPDPIIPYAVESDGSERPTGMILALGRMKYDPARVGWYMNVTFKFDHRLVDGVPAIKFVVAIKDYIESRDKAEDFVELVEGSKIFIGEGNLANVLK